MKSHCIYKVFRPSPKTGARLRTCVRAGDEVEAVEVSLSEGLGRTARWYARAGWFSVNP